MSNPFVLDTYPVSLSACLLIGTTLNSLSGIKIKPSKEWQSNPTFIYISILIHKSTVLLSTQHHMPGQHDCVETSFALQKMSEYVFMDFLPTFPHCVYKKRTRPLIIHRKVNLWSSLKSFLIDQINGVIEIK